MPEKGTLTVADIQAAMDSLREQDIRDRERQARRIDAWLALDLDWAAMTEDERQALQIAMSCELIVHPTVAAQPDALIERYRRDR